MFNILEYLKRKETKRRGYEAKQKVILDAKKAEEAKINQRSKLLIHTCLFSGKNVAHAYLYFGCNLN